MKVSTGQVLLRKRAELTDDRRGVTLVEVLMSLMIMAIGVSSVAVLFPISVLRSIKASQLTNATILKHNVDVLTDVQSELIFDPDGDYRSNLGVAARRTTLDEHFRTPAARNYIVDPVGFYTHLDDQQVGLNANGSAPGFAGTFGNTGTDAFGVPRWGGGLTATDGRGPIDAAHRKAIRLKAMALANQGDGWETQIDAQAVGLVTGGVTLSADLDLSQVPTAQLVLPPDGNGGYLVADPELYRVVVFSLDGRFSQAYPLVAINRTASPQIAYFSEDLNNNGGLDALEDVNMNGAVDIRSLPAEFGGVVTRVLLQSKRVNDYSWMLNVRRRGDGQARSVDVVVRFNDGVSITDERVFQATFVPSSSTPPVTRRSVWVRKPSRSTPADTTEPKIRKGGFVFDAINGIWYRIQDVQDAPLFPAAGSLFNDFDYLVTLQEDIKATDGAGAVTGTPLTLAPVPAGPYGAAMFPTGIVDVYPMGSRNVPEHLKVPAF